MRHIMGKCLQFIDKLAEGIFWLFEKIFHTYVRSPSALRWGIIAFLLTWALFFLSLFATMLLTPSVGGGIMTWVFLTFGVLFLILFIILGTYYNRHPTNINSTDDALTSINSKLDTVVSSLKELNNSINELIKRIDERWPK
jgi:hypothetical protein